MLITRCPDCKTSFRITVEQLHKADGKVRCGECAAVFSAFDSLADSAAESEAAESIADSAAVWEATESIAGKPLQSEAPEAAQDNAQERTATRAAPELAQDADEADDNAEAAEEAEVAAIPDSEVEQVLEVSHAELVPPWSPDTFARPVRYEPPAWRVAAALALLVFVGQAVHHYRGTLVQQPFVGEALSGLYSKLGFPIEPTWDPSAFEIEARMATAQSAQDAQGSLEIAAGIRNVSKRPLPYPIIHLQLTDRWEKALGTRMFEPSEYLPGSGSRRAVLRPGASAEVKLNLVDPGPDAYGFQVDVCVPAGRTQVRCKADAVFE
jgi:predicted Zn finger-like uncharacterized protein